MRTAALGTRTVFERSAPSEPVSSTKAPEAFSGWSTFDGGGGTKRHVTNRYVGYDHLSAGVPLHHINRSGPTPLLRGRSRSPSTPNEGTFDVSEITDAATRLEVNAVVLLDYYEQGGGLAADLRTVIAAARTAEKLFAENYTLAAMTEER